MPAFYEHNNRPDPGKPNHCFHDALGDPCDCTGDHSHPTRVLMRGLAQLVMATAAGAAVAVMILVVYALAAMVL